MKKLAIMLAVLPVIGCATGGIRYDAPLPATDRATVAAEYAGVYREQMPARAAVMPADDGWRVVVISELGMKLIDMKVMEQTADIYFRAGFVPGGMVADFVKFFRAEFFADAAKPPGREVLWMDKL